MLVDPQFRALIPGPGVCSQDLHDLQFKIRVQRGIYATRYLNFQHLLSNAKRNFYPYLGKYFSDDFAADQGVVDSPEQFVTLFSARLEADPRKLCASLTLIDKKYPKGWRWEKWGEYYGTQKPQAYYLEDEPIIDHVFVYHLFELE